MTKEHEVTKIGTREEWLAARLKLLEAEKALTRQSDALAEQRRNLPWVKVEKNYVFDTNEGEKTLRDLFAGRSQLMIYHFMFGRTADAGCPVCTMHAESFDRAIVHLKRKDVTMLCASRGPLDKLNAYKKRMGFGFDWVSSGRSDFNFDYGVSRPDGADPEKLVFNFTAKWSERNLEEHAGLSSFALKDGQIYHTYSCHIRGLEDFNVTYQLLDRAPLGRNEGDGKFRASWLRRRDEYESVAGAL